MSATRDAVAIAHPEPLRLGISTCLLGQNVRYDGGHKRNSFRSSARRLTATGRDWFR